MSNETKPIWNVIYDTPYGTKTYLMVNVDRKTALYWARKCKEKYVGKPYPNGKGYYQVWKVRVVSNI